jgi:hypothetical protein
MEENNQAREVPYHEYQIIADLLRAHTDAHEGRLKAVVAFGDVVTRGASYDIDLLEIVEGWNGARVAEFDSTADLPLRGKLRLYFSSPEDFQDPKRIEDPTERQWVEDLIERVRARHEVIVQARPGLVEAMLARTGRGRSAYTAPPSGSVTYTNPFDLTRGRR